VRHARRKEREKEGICELELSYWNSSFDILVLVLDTYLFLF